MRRPGRPGRAAAAGRRRRRSWPRALDGVLRRALQRRAARRAAVRRRAAVDHRAHRRSRHRQDHHGRPAAGAARRPGSARDRRPLRIALAAPTGKAAARLQEAVRARARPRCPARRPARGVGRRRTAMTLHRLLAGGPTTHPVPARPRQPAQYDVVVVDEYVDGVADDDGPAARGGPARRPGWCWSATRDQLDVGRAPGRCSSDLVAGYDGRADSPVVAPCATNSPLRAEHIGALAEALRVGDADAVLAALRAGHDEVEFVDDRRRRPR